MMRVAQNVHPGRSWTGVRVEFHGVDAGKCVRLSMEEEGSSFDVCIHYYRGDPEELVRMLKEAFEGLEVGDEG